MGSWSQDQCPPAIYDVDANEGYISDAFIEDEHTEAEVQEHMDYLKLQAWALEARLGLIDPELAAYLDENMPGWRDL